MALCCAVECLAVGRIQPQAWNRCLGWLFNPATHGVSLSMFGLTLITLVRPAYENCSMQYYRRLYEFVFMFYYHTADEKWAYAGRHITFCHVYPWVSLIGRWTLGASGQECFPAATISPASAESLSSMPAYYLGIL